MDAVPDELHAFSRFLHTQFFPASRGLSRRGNNERRERPLPAFYALFDEAADQISGFKIFYVASTMGCNRIF